MYLTTVDIHNFSDSVQLFASARAACVGIRGCRRGRANSPWLPERAPRQGTILDDISALKAADSSSDGSTVASSESAPDTSGLRVRLLESRDRDSIGRILKQHHATTVFRNQPFSEEKFDRHFQLVLSRPPRMAGLVAVWNGEMLGGTWVSADSYMLSDGPLFSTVQVIAVDLERPPLRRAKVFLALIAGLKQWAASMGASHTFVHVTTGSNIKATDRLMRASGAKFIGGAYVV